MPEPQQPPMRSAILDGALTAFAAKGFAGCSVPEIADASGVAVGTLYRYFPSKEALVNELYRAWKQQLAETVLRHVAPEPADARELFDGFWDGMTAFVRDHPVAYRFLERHHHEPYLDEASRAVSGGLEQLVLGQLTEAQARGEIRAGEPAVLAMLVWGAFGGVVHGIDLFPDVVDDDAVRSARDLAWALLDPSLDRTVAGDRTKETTT